MIKPRDDGGSGRGAPPPTDPPPSAPNRGGPNRLATAIALWFGTGLLRPAPGTWGSLAATVMGMGLLTLGPWFLAGGAVLATGVGIWAAARYQATTGRHDASEVVVDEVAGQWIALCALPLAGLGLSVEGAAAAFVLFRLFDIAKPGPIGWADRRLAGGLGVMLDDVLAGIAAGAILWALATWTGLGDLATGG
ncbi:phosphatidylglycerophosphatase A [Marivibrio halodurans]|uniref:Phosphatidylglycerophosphatase A n=2 Tax=Marivibrio halodurans TaxID=2039722 RepID=A0A8J7RYV8_9PROT|nr:phosphatidylglycerophosphatase A [Marivibrio halodurans]